MDGIHDLGGRVGYGPVDVHEPEEQFHHAWEERFLGVLRAMTRPVPWSIDWFRQVREQIGPVDYLTRPYYDSWLQTYAAMMVHSGMATVEELASGKSDEEISGLPEPIGPAVVAATKTQTGRFERAARGKPRFTEGDGVIARSEASVGHTRLPQYARGRRGLVLAYRGDFILPDSNAADDGHGEALYTVGFAAAELWPEAASRRDRVFIDLWESYLEPA